MAVVECRVVAVQIINYQDISERTTKAMSRAREIAESVVAGLVDYQDRVIKPHGIPLRPWLIKAIVEALRQRESEVREACAKIAEVPYGDDVEALAGDEPQAVGQKIARAIRRNGTQEGSND